MPSNPRSDALAALAQFLVTESSLGETLLRVSQIATDAMPAAEMAGISMLAEDGRPTTGVFTDEESPEMDSAQYESGRGPCLDAWRLKHVVVIDDMAEAATDYPEFSAVARQHGVLSTISLPLIVADEGIGALNLYARVRNGFSDHGEMGMELAAAAAVVLANASAYWSAFEHGANLAEAMKSRATIEQAKGMLMAKSPRVTPDEAFELLRSTSQRQNRKVRDIAKEMVERETPIPDETDGTP